MDSSSLSKYLTQLSPDMSDWFVWSTFSARAVGISMWPNRFSMLIQWPLRTCTLRLILLGTMYFPSVQTCEFPILSIKFIRSRLQPIINYLTTPTIIIITNCRKMRKKDELFPESEHSLPYHKPLPPTMNTISHFESVQPDKDQQSTQSEEVFEKLLWGDQHNDKVIVEIFEKKVLEGLVEKSRNMEGLIKGFILIMMNCQHRGILHILIVKARLPHLILKRYLAYAQQKQDMDEILQYLGSFLKAYNRLFLPEYLTEYFIDKETHHFQLLETCYEFHNCPQPLTRTTVWNIVLALLKEKEVRQFVEGNEKRRSYFLVMFDQISDQLRNSLIEIEQVMGEGDFGRVLAQVEDVVALWEDISDSYRVLQAGYQAIFVKNVILPLLIGSIPDRTQKSLFSLKFSLFVLRKLIPVMKNLGVLNIMVEIIFEHESIVYSPQKMQRSQEKEFSLSELQEVKMLQFKQNKMENFGNGIKQMFKRLFKSKDSQFILLVTALLSSLITHSSKAKKHLPHSFLFQCLVRQLKQTHSLMTIVSILNSLISMCPLPQLNQNQLIQYCRQIIQSTNEGIRMDSAVSQQVVECFQYDCVELLRVQTSKRLQKCLEGVFGWDPVKESEQFYSFYESMPDSPAENLRYLTCKLLLLSKFLNPLQPTFEKPVSKSPLIQGLTYPLAHLQHPYIPAIPCQIIDESNRIPTLWVKDETYFIIAFHNKSAGEFKVIATIKYKNIMVERVEKREKIYLVVGVRNWKADKKRMENNRQTMKVKGVEGAYQVLLKNRQVNRGKEKDYILKVIGKIEEGLPSYSLI